MLRVCCGAPLTAPRPSTNKSRPPQRSLGVPASAGTRPSPYTIPSARKAIIAPWFENAVLYAVRTRFRKGKRDRRQITFDWGTPSDKVHLLMDAAHHFETPGARTGEHLSEVIRYTCGGYQLRTPGRAVQTGLKRCLKFIPYKNHNLRLTFASEADARAFMTMFGIEQSLT